MWIVYLSEDDLGLSKGLRELYDCSNFANFIEQTNEKTIKEFFNKILDVVKMLGLKESGYRLITNSGSNGGQEVPHYHVHIIGGEPLGRKIN